MDRPSRACRCKPRIAGGECREANASDMFLAQTFETDAARPLSALKILAARAADRRSGCPADVLSEILQKALAVLYARRDLDQ